MYRGKVPFKFESTYQAQPWWNKNPLVKMFANSIHADKLYFVIPNKDVLFLTLHGDTWKETSNLLAEEKQMAGTACQCGFPCPLHPVGWGSLHQCRMCVIGKPPFVLVCYLTTGGFCSCMGKFSSWPIKDSFHWQKKKASDPIATLLPSIETSSKEC